jgi:hypothetical protein
MEVYQKISQNKNPSKRERGLLDFLKNFTIVTCDRGQSKISEQLNRKQSLRELLRPKDKLTPLSKKQFLGP